MHWDPLVQKMISDFRIMVPNFSHLYMSNDRLLFTIQIEKFAHFLREKFPNQKVNLVGTSYGGALCWGLALRYPQLVESLSLINPMVSDPLNHFAPTELKYFFKVPLKAKHLYILLSTSLGKSFLLKVAELFRDERLDGPGKIDRLEGRKLQFISGVIAHFSWILRNEDWSYWNGELNKNKVPTHLIFDTQDPLFEEKTYLDFADRLNVDNVSMTQGKGHLSIKTASDELADLLSQFLNERPEVKKASGE